jgi:hypothetical protein
MLSHRQEKLEEKVAILLSRRWRVIALNLS